MNEFLGLDEKVAVVTGGASGLGQAVARGLVREGARVVLADVDVAGLDQTVAELGKQARGKPTDVARRDEVTALFQEAQDKAVADGGQIPIVTLPTVWAGRANLTWTPRADEDTLAYFIRPR